MPRKSASEERNTAIDYLNRDIVNVKTELQTLNKLVRDGNGQPSLLARVTTLSSDMAYMQTEVKKEIEGLKDMICQHHKDTMEKNKLNWQFKTAVFVAVIGSASSLLMHFFK